MPHVCKSYRLLRQKNFIPTFLFSHRYKTYKSCTHSHSEQHCSPFTGYYVPKKFESSCAYSAYSVHIRWLFLTAVPNTTGLTISYNYDYCLHLSRTNSLKLIFGGSLLEAISAYHRRLLFKKTTLELHVLYAFITSSCWKSQI